jgi:hypothetical protein
MKENFLNDNSSILKIYNGDESSLVVGNVENHTISLHWVRILVRQKLGPYAATRLRGGRWGRERAPDSESPVVIAPAAHDRLQKLIRVQTCHRILRLVIRRYVKNTPFFSRPNTETRFLPGVGASD